MSLMNANAKAIPLSDKSIHCIVTSPPYWGLRNYGVDGQLGLENLPDCLGWATGKPCGVCFICQMMDVSRECWRVLRDDGTMWVNIGDCYINQNGYARANEQWQRLGRNDAPSNNRSLSNLNKAGWKTKDMAFIPARLALALQARGWYVRNQIIWYKPNCMPGSQTDRLTNSYEVVYLCAKQPRYFFDGFAIREPAVGTGGGDFSKTCAEAQPNHGGVSKRKTVIRKSFRGGGAYTGAGVFENSILRENETHGNQAGSPTRMKRDVWTIPTQSYRGAHYATFPEALAELCILAGTSAHGVCSECNAPHTRVTKTTGGQEKSWHDHIEDDVRGQRGQPLPEGYDIRHVGWKPSCKCKHDRVVPARVFDPFVGSGTTVKIAKRNGRRGLGIDLSLKYLRDNALPRAMNTNTAEVMAELPLFIKSNNGKENANATTEELVNEESQ